MSHGTKATLSKLCEIKHPLVTELPDFRVSLDPWWVSLDPCSALSTVVSSADGDGSLVKSSDGMDFLQHTELHQMWRNKMNTLSLRTWWCRLIQDSETQFSSQQLTWQPINPYNDLFVSSNSLIMNINWKPLQLYFSSKLLTCPHLTCLLTS